jgi:putative FmdB family regulatory protein
MPIFEFKCIKCQEYMEILVMGSDDKDVEMKCSKCGSEESGTDSEHHQYQHGSRRNSQIPSCYTDTLLFRRFLYHLESARPLPLRLPPSAGERSHGRAYHP